MQDIALFAPIEGNLRDINTTKQGLKRYFEKEAIRAFTCWRKNGGWLKDIPIYAICATGNGISLSTKKEFEKINVTYIEEYMKETETFDCGFWNIPLVGKWAQKNLPHTDLIKIDLDMYLLRSLPESWFGNGDIIGLHTSGAHPYLEKMGNEYIEYKKFYNTGLTITRKGSIFFEKQMQILLELENEFKNGNFKEKYGLEINYDVKDEEHFEYCLLEELAVSIMERDGFKINPIQYYYIEAEEYEEMDLDNVYFIHEHIEESIDKDKLFNKAKYRKQFKGFPGYEYYLTQ